MSTNRNFERIGGRLKAGAVRALRNRGEHCLFVPCRMQVDGHCCSLCSALMVAEFCGVKIDAELVERFERNNGDSTETGPMTRFLRGNGLRVDVRREGETRVDHLIDALECGTPTIVSVRPPHYLVAVGYDSRFFYVKNPLPSAAYPVASPGGASSASGPVWRSLSPDGQRRGELPGGDLPEDQRTEVILFTEIRALTHAVGGVMENFPSCSTAPNPFCGCCLRSG